MAATVLQHTEQLLTGANLGETGEKGGTENRG